MIMHTKKNKQAGFTLIELLVVILIVGILAAVGLPMYLGYAKDARMSEGKSLIGSLWTAMRGCAQTTGGGAGVCDADGQFTRIGVSAVGLTGNGQWTLGPVTGANASLAGASNNQYALNGGPLTATGVATKVTENLIVAFNYAAGADPPGTFTCSTDGNLPAATDLC